MPYHHEDAQAAYKHCIVESSNVQNQKTVDKKYPDDTLLSHEAMGEELLITVYQHTSTVTQRIYNF